MAEGELSRTEKLTLWGLVQFPEMTDKAVAEKLDIKPSTLSQTKKRLSNRGYYFTVRVPMLHSLGYELLYLVSGRLNPLVPFETRFALDMELNGKIGENVYAVTDYSQAVSIALSKSFVDFQINKENIETAYSQLDLIEGGGFSYAIFPFKLSRIFKYFDYGPLLKQVFDIDAPVPTPEPVEPGPGRAALTRVEKKVYYGLVKYPEMSDTVLSSTLRVSRNTVAKCRKKFTEEGLIKTIRIPDLNKIGFEIFAYSHARFNPRSARSTREKGIELIKKEPSFVLFVSSNLESAQLAVAKNFEEYQRVRSEVIRFYRQHDFLLHEPEMLLFSIPTMKILKNHDYSYLVKKALEI
jgi:predicted transcriptional regulator